LVLLLSRCTAIAILVLEPQPLGVYEHRVVVTIGKHCVNFMVCIHQGIDAVKVATSEGFTSLNVKSALGIGYTR
jgi:hypothetical protein